MVKKHENTENLAKMIKFINTSKIKYLCFALILCFALTAVVGCNSEKKEAEKGIETDKKGKGAGKKGQKGKKGNTERGKKS